jgi:hypothetical protein
MTALFDIFEVESNGSVLWIGSAETIADAKARIRENSMRSPRQYFLFNQTTGSKLVINLDDSDIAPHC